MQLPFQAVLNMDKLISGVPNWSEPDGADQKIQITAALESDEITLQGFELVGRALAYSPDRNVSFSLLYHPTGSRRDAVILARVDWRPLTPHTNEHDSAPAHLAMLTISGTHHHSFDLNWRNSLARPLKGMLLAEPISPDFQGFADLLDGVGNLFRINNIKDIPEPKWVVGLFER